MSALRFVLFFGLVLLSDLGLALEWDDNRLSAFGTLGLVQSSNDVLVFRRDVTQKTGSSDHKLEWANDSLFGAQLDTRWSDQFSTTLQLVAKERIHQSVQNSVEWALIRYRPLDSLDIRAGRLGTDIFMLADYRQVGYAYAWVRPPQEFYGLLSFYHFDGMDITKKFHFDNSELTTKIFYGGSHETYPIDIDAQNTFKLAFKGGGFTSVLEKNNWKYRISYADVTLTNNNPSLLVDGLRSVSALYPPANAIAQAYVTKNQHLKYFEAGLSYDNNQWWAQAEFTQLNSDIAILPSAQVAYISGGWRFQKKSVFATYSNIRPTDELTHYPLPSGLPSPLQENISALVNGAELGVNMTRSDQHSIGIGLRWDFKPKMALKFQVDKFFVEDFGASIWLKKNNQLVTTNQNSLVSSVTLDFVF